LQLRGGRSGGQQAHEHGKNQLLHIPILCI
jgi:hypothetical protein